MSDVLLIVIPIVVVLVILKVCLICWRVWIYQKRREQQRNIMVRQQTASRRTTARVVAARLVSNPDGGVAQQTCYVIQQPGCPPRQLTRTVIVRPSGRPVDPNLPPTYDQAVTGKDRSVKVEEGQPPQNPAVTTPSAPPPSFPAPPPAGPMAPPPLYTPRSSQMTINDADDSVDADERRRLLS